MNGYVSPTSILLIGGDPIYIQLKRKKKKNVWRTNNFTKLTINGITNKHTNKQTKNKKGF